MTDRWAYDGQMDVLSHTLTMRGSEVASLAEFHPVVSSEVS